MESEPFAEHAQNEHRSGKKCAQPKTPAHRGVLGIRPFFRDDIHGLKGHSAFWTCARAPLHHLGMHRARIANLFLFGGRSGRECNRFLGNRGAGTPHWRRAGNRKELLRRAVESFRTSARTEVICLANELASRRGFRRFNIHSANGIALHYAPSRISDAAAVIAGACKSGRAVRHTWRSLLLF